MDLASICVIQLQLYKICRSGKCVIRLTHCPHLRDLLSDKHDPWVRVVPFQYYVWHFRPPTKMAATAELNLT
jgi:hypothetical protein